MNTDVLDQGEPEERIGRGAGALEKFDTTLSTRTKLPPDRLQEVLTMRSEGLRHESREVGAILERFARVVVDSWERPEAADAFLGSLDLKAVSRDHDWRTVFAAVRGRGPEDIEFKRAALVRYLQYLGFRKRLVEYVRTRRQGLAETDAYTDITRLPGRHGHPGAGADLPGTDEEFIRAPLGETLELRLPGGLRVDLMLGPHLFQLAGARHPCLLDGKGEMSFLRPGRNMVGRHPESDVVIDADFGHVSRAHLILDCEPPDRVRIIDLSSRGTWLRRSVLARARSVPG